MNQAWCVQGDTHRNGAEFTLEWTNAVTVAEIVYYGRTAWFAEECWKDYEVLAEGSADARGAGHASDGPRPAAHPARASRSAHAGSRCDFISSYGGLNPGASEIQVFSEPAAGELLRQVPQAGARRAGAGLRRGHRSRLRELAARLASGGLGFDQLLVVRRHELNPSHVYTYHVEGFGAGGGLYLRARSARPGALEELVASPEGQILDCDLSFDGKEILFSWRRKQGEGYQVFVINADGTNLRQLTDGPHHNYNACWLPDGGIAFLTTRSSRFAYCWISPVGILHRMERDGSSVTRLSANIVNDFTPSVLEDGRIIYSRWEYVDKPAIPIQSLWTIHPDGTGLAGFFGNRVLSPATFMEARSIPGHGQGAVPADQPQRPVPRRHRHHGYRPRQQRRRRHPQPDAGGEHRPGGQRRRQPDPRAVRKSFPAGQRSTSWSPSAARCWCAATTARRWRRSLAARADSASTTPAAAARAPRRRCWPRR